MDELSCLLIFTWTPTKNRQRVNDLAAFSEITVIRLEAHTKRAETAHQGNALAGFHAHAAAMEAIRVVRNVNKVHFAFEK